MHRKLAQYKGEQLEGLDVKTLGVLLAEMNDGADSVPSVAAAETPHVVPRRLRPCPITQNAWSTRTWRGRAFVSTMRLAAVGALRQVARAMLPLAHSAW